MARGEGEAAAVVEVDKEGKCEDAHVLALLEILLCLDSSVF